MPMPTLVYVSSVKVFSCVDGLFKFEIKMNLKARQAISLHGKSVCLFTYNGCTERETNKAIGFVRYMCGKKLQFVLKEIWRSGIIFRKCRKYARETRLIFSRRSFYIFYRVIVSLDRCIYPEAVFANPIYTILSNPTNYCYIEIAL